MFLGEYHTWSDREEALVASGLEIEGDSIYTPWIIHFSDGVIDLDLCEIRGENGDTLPIGNLTAEQVVAMILAADSHFNMEYGNV